MTVTHCQANVSEVSRPKPTALPSSNRQLDLNTPIRRADAIIRRQSRRLGRSFVPKIVWSLFAACAVLGCCVTATAQEAKRPWRETFQVDAPLLVAKRFENARGLIESAEWEAALKALADLEEEFPGALVNVSHGRFLNVATTARLLRVQLPAEGLEAYRQQIDGWADQQYLAAVAAHDDAALHGLLRSAYASRSGDDALDTLAEWAWERGDISTARRLWTQLISREPPSADRLLLSYPDTDHDMAAIHARLILCSLAEGDVDRAVEELDVFTTLFPGEAGHLAGWEGLFDERLGELIGDEDDWDVTSQDKSCPTFARTPSRNGTVRRRVRLGRPKWTLPLPPVYVPRWERPRAALPEKGLLSRYPVTLGTGVFFHDGTTIHGLKLEDGKPLWPLHGDAPSDETPGKVYPPFATMPNALPWTPIVGIPRFTATIDEGRLYALLGPSILTLPPGERQASPTRLVCINLAQGQGRIEWFHLPEDLFPPGWLVTGTPVADGDSLYVTLLRSEPQIEVAVARLRSYDGSVVWQQTVGQALRAALRGRVELGHQLLTFAAGRLFLSTDFGGVAALDASSGRVEWVVTYRSDEPGSTARSDETALGLMPPVYHEGIILAKPNDGGDLLAIDAETGFIHWRRPVPGPIVHLLGVTNNTLLASGDQLWAIGLDTGRLRWRFGYDDASGYGYGRGAIVGDRVFWPTHDELFVVDVATGSPVQRVRLYDALGVTGGNIITDDDRLLIAGPNHLTAFGLHQ